jgi:hypothetical protein
MPDLDDGESLDVPGSAGATYTIKNVGGVYACNCMAWRTQSLPVDRRTCKHIRRLRGDAAEDARVGFAAAPRHAVPKPKPVAEPVAVAAQRLPAPRDTEAIVLDYHVANGRVTGFRCRLGDGQALAVTAGVTDRDCPPPVGGIVTVRYQQVTATGVPVAATLVRRESVTS